MASADSFKGVYNLGDSLLSDQLESNLFSFLSWATLGIGGFSNVTIGASGAYGGQPSLLRPVEDPNYVSGQVWEGFRKDWVWETGVNYPYQPIRVSGVYVNGTFQPVSGVGPYAHTVNYPNGQIVFNNPISPSSTVRAEFSYRTVQYYTADTPWWQELQTNSLRNDDPQFLQQGSGAWSTDAQNRVQLPAVVIEAVPNSSRRPLEIGDLAAIVRQEVRFHILSEDRPNMKALHDILTFQWQKRLNSFDKNQILANDKYPLDMNGFVTPSGLMYPQMTSQFPWAQIRFMDMRSREQPRLGSIRYATVIATCEVDTV